MVVTAIRPLAAISALQRVIATEVKPLKVRHPRPVLLLALELRVHNVHAAALGRGCPPPFVSVVVIVTVVVVDRISPKWIDMLLCLCCLGGCWLLAPA
jgi:hypothetical protein